MSMFVASPWIGPQNDMFLDQTDKLPRFIYNVNSFSNN